MLTIHVSSSKKVSGATPYSSDQYHAGLEMEVADNLVGSHELAETIDHLYRICNAAVETQIARRPLPTSAPTGKNAVHGKYHASGNSHSPEKELEKGQGAPAHTPPPTSHCDPKPISAKQIAFIEALAFQRLRMREEDFVAVCGKIAGKPQLQHFSKEQGSALIDYLHKNVALHAPVTK